MVNVKDSYGIFVVIFIDVEIISRVIKPFKN